MYPPLPLLRMMKNRPLSTGRVRVVVLVRCVRDVLEDVLSV